MSFDANPIFNPVADSPEFQQLVTKHKAFMQSEREWVKKQLAQPSFETVSSSLN